MSFMNRTDWKLLARYVAGEITDKEEKAVEIWAEKRPENRILLNEIKSDWKKMDQITPQFNVDKAWNALHNRINADRDQVHQEPVIQKRAGQFRIPMLLKVAASLLLIAVLGFALVNTYNKFHKVNIVASLNEKGKSVRLPDGSVAYMNTNATLSYPGRFGKKLREIHLSGEAYFEVTPDKKKPFIIYTGDARIRVVGTSFNVNSNSGNQVEVYVTTGIVELSENGNLSNRVLIKPGDIGTIDKKRVNLVKADNANSIAWKTRILTFSDTPLREAVSLLKDVYDVNIVMKGKGIDTIKVNGDYNGDPLNIILKAISANNNLFAVAKSDDTIYLSQ